MVVAAAPLAQRQKRLKYLLILDGVPTLPYSHVTQRSSLTYDWSRPPTRIIATSDARESIVYTAGIRLRASASITRIRDTSCSVRVLAHQMLPRWD